MGPINLQLASPHNKAFFWHLYVDAMHSHIMTLWGWDEQWQRTAFDKRWDDCFNWLIVSNETVLGYTQTYNLDKYCYIEMLIIAESYRNRGVARSALATLDTVHNRPAVVLRVFKTNARALKFYQALGFCLKKTEDKFYLLEKIL